MEEEELFCKDCQMVYDDLHSFKKHVRKRHPTKSVQPIPQTKQEDDRPKFSCDICLQNFSTLRGMNIHKNSCQKRTPKPNSIDDDSLACSDCEMDFDNVIDFKKHMRDHRDNCLSKIQKIPNGSPQKVPRHYKKKPQRIKETSNVDFEIYESANSNNKCDITVRKSPRMRKPISYANLIESNSESDYEKDIPNTKKPKTKCMECFIQCRDPKELLKHEENYHETPVKKIRRLLCQMCSKCFKNPGALRKHCRKFHPEKWIELSRKLRLRMLKKSHKKIMCKGCDSKFLTFSELRKHIRRKHYANIELTENLYKGRCLKKPFQCDNCPSSFHSTCALKNHSKEEHPDAKQLGKNGRNISCYECNTKYSHMSGLRKHTRKHHANKLIELAPRLYRFKRNLTKNILLKKRKLTEQDMIDLDRYKCSVCKSSYSNVSNLRKHLRRFHPEKLPDIAPLLRDKTMFKYPCDLCVKKFNCLRNFRNHQRQCHPEVATPIRCVSKPNKINRCPLCHFEHAERKSLLQHFKVDHDIEVTTDPVNVSNLDEFSKWKADFEKETNSRFVKEYHFSCSSHDVFSYICHRSGYYSPKGKGLRHMKAQGSSKINGYCPAAIKVKKLKDGTVKVTYCRTHIGHTTDITHLHLTPSERRDIAEKIAANIPFQDILQSMRDSATSESDLKRIHMLSKKDLYNIKSSFNLSSQSVKETKPKAENANLEHWIDDLKKNDSCVIFHKRQGEILDEHQQFTKDDFLLIIMNQTQRDKLRKFGHDTICIDRSFDRNYYQLELYTILVLNETDEGFPCAFLVTNRSDLHVMVLFFDYVKRCVGAINAKVFMSDMQDYFYRAWTTVMMECSNRFYCKWLIENSWKKKLSMIKSKFKQDITYSKLKKVLEEKHISIFRMSLAATVVDLTDDDVKKFAKYMSENYLENDDLWPTSAGPYIDVKSNSHLERMHKTLKHLFLNGKNAKNFGKALSDTIRFIKEKLFDRTILINRGKINNKMKIAIFRHKLSLHLKTDDITKTDEGWLIPSSETSETYVLNEIQPSCRCEFICQECKSCVHRFFCTCLDSCVKWNMCKHIHLLCRYLNSTSYVKPNNVEQKWSVPPIQQQQENLQQEEQQQGPQQNHQEEQEVDTLEQLQPIVYIKQVPRNLEPSHEAHQIKFIKQQTIEYVKQPSHIEYIKQHPQHLEHIQVQHIQVDNNVDHVESTYIYCNEANQREMDAILAEVNICNLETVQVTQIPSSCTIQIPSCTVVSQGEQISADCSGSFGEVADTKESLKMKFLKMLEEASSPTELDVVQKMLASITPTLEVIKGSDGNHQVLFPI